MSYLAVFIREKDGRFSVSVPALPGCFSQGDTFDEAQKNIAEAVALYLEDEEVEITIQQIVEPIDVPVKL